MRASVIFILLLCSSHVFGASLESALMPGQVTQAHAKVEEDCAQCHQKFDKNAQDKLCLVCHKPILADQTQHQGFHGRLASNTMCRSCHTEHKGRDKSIVLLDTSNFDHSKTDFELLGKHQPLACKKCHLDTKKWRDAPQQCVDCHQNKDPHKGSLGTQCQNCHNSDNWQQAKFDHSKTKLPLVGAHEPLACEKCHINKQWKLADSSCRSCHKKDDVHKNGFGERCETCHNSTHFKPALSFDHESNTLFKLLDSHRTVQCKACHSPGVSAHGLGKTCVSCHKADDPHNGKLGNRCESCHNEIKWQQSSFNHNNTAFALHNKHASIKCSACHASASFSNTPKQCNACHQKDDKHHGAFGTQCQQCHDDSKWNNTHFDHSKEGHWPLLGAHAKTACNACHIQSTTTVKLNTQCASCHQKQDVHKGELGKQCESCHNESSFKSGIQFNHALSRFPLRGAHLQVRCADCHRDKLFVGTPQQCVDCHRSKDIHQGSYGNNCAQCHNERHFMLWQFDHHRTGFDLSGAHSKLNCVQCHAPGSSNKSNNCSSCHAKDDRHDGQFGPNCNSCHSLDKWRPALMRKNNVARGNANEINYRTNTQTFCAITAVILCGPRVSDVFEHNTAIAC